MARPDWLVPGADVVEYTSIGARTAQLTPTTIDRVLTRDVVLANGHRYNADRLIIHRGRWDPSTHLLSADDPRVTAAKLANRRSNSRTQALKAIDKLRAAVNHMDPHKPLDVDMVPLVDDARNALGRLLAALPAGDDPTSEVG
jgi:hypothetical protein